MIASAFTGAVGAYYSGSAWVGLLCGAAAGVLLAAIIAGLSIYCGGDQVVIGIGLNLLGPGLSYLIMYTIWGKPRHVALVAGILSGRYSVHSGHSRSWPIAQRA